MPIFPEVDPETKLFPKPTMDALAGALGSVTTRTDPDRPGVLLVTFGAPALDPGSTAPSFTTQPASASYAEGEEVTLAVAASGNPTPSYTWQRRTGSTGPWTTIPGAVSPTYSFTASLQGSGTSYRALATNTVAITVSSIATIDVYPNTSPPVITDFGSWTSMLESDVAIPVTMIVTGIPAPSVTFEKLPKNASSGSWTAATGVTSSIIPGAGSTRYLVPVSNWTSPVEGDTIRLRAVVSNSAGSIYSSVVTVTVLPIP